MEVVAPINIVFHIIMFSRRRKAFKPVRSFDIRTGSVLSVTLGINGGSQTLGNIGTKFGNSALEFIQKSAKLVGLDFSTLLGEGGG